MSNWNSRSGSREDQVAISVGDKIANDSYTVRGIREGGFSQVLIVEDWTGGLLRAMKRIRDDRWNAISDKRKVTKQFMDEILVWQTKLRGCPYTVEALMTFPDFYGLGPVAFMDVVEGPSLQKLRRDCVRLSVRQTIRLASQIAEALTFAHRAGVTHRDLTPANVLLTRSDEVRVIDWGLASVRGAAGEEAFTPGYASPQRASRPEINDPEDDVFAFGVLVYECLTGRSPDRRQWNDDDVAEGLARSNVTIPEEVRDLVVRCLRYNPQERPDFPTVWQTLSDASLERDLRKWELETPFCKTCAFVSASEVPPLRRCPICAESLWTRDFERPAEGMVRIDAGNFIAGLSDEQLDTALQAARAPRASQDDREELVGKGHRRVFLPAFDIDVFPVTNAQYQEFCEATHYPAHETLADKVRRIPNHPVVNLTWKDALCFALWKRRRLPSPLEWERAGRGDEDTRKYPWGDIWRQGLCNNSSFIKETKTTPVDWFTTPQRDGRSPDGVADMVGNVREWVTDGTRGGMKGLKGGSWGEGCILEGLVTRGIDADVDYQDEATGFRCAADPAYVERQLDGGQ
jgi:formylglycine-generating enzyme required for sulfatase activity